MKSACDDSCAFFGHRDTPECVADKLTETIVKLIEKNGVKKFYVGVNGAFDLLCYRIVKELKLKYPHIKYQQVLAYIPIKKKEFELYDGEHTVIPDGIEKIPKRFAIIYRNKWMLKKCKYVITYVTRSFGGAAQIKELAEKQKKVVINLSDS